jgi:hypothetical protein
MAPHGIDLRDQADGRTGVSLGSRNGSAQTRAASTNDHNVVPGNLDHTTSKQA